MGYPRLDVNPAVIDRFDASTATVAASALELALDDQSANAGASYVVSSSLSIVVLKMGDSSIDVSVDNAVDNGVAFVQAVGTSPDVTAYKFSVSCTNGLVNIAANAAATADLKLALWVPSVR
jgi:hypothetical protein